MEENASIGEYHYIWDDELSDNLNYSRKYFWEKFAKTKPSLVLYSKEGSITLESLLNSDIDTTQRK
jgi:hypothetical protein